MIHIGNIPYGGWKRCLRIANKNFELLVTLDVGPRIIRCGFTGEKNVFVEYAEQMGTTGGNEYHSYGGHRLWIAPEEKPKTYFPDNHPVEWHQTDKGIQFRPPPESTGFQKELHVWLDPNRPLVRVLHRITNISASPLTASVWAVSVMAPGGRGFFPQEPYKPHPQHLLPARPLVLWSYTDMSDPRWTWGKYYAQLAQTADPNPQKAGAFNSPGWAAYLNDGTVFVKRFPASPDENYPDYGCNFEIFTNSRMLELESLGPLRTIAPGESLEHEEQWIVAKAPRAGASDDDVRSLIEPILAQL